MKALIYRNNRCQVPGWESFHQHEPLGYAYETDDRFVHIFGREGRLWNISNGLSVTALKQGTLRNWVEATFGAQNIEESDLEVGETVEGVWRPGLYYDDEMLQGLGETDVNRRLAEQAVLLLIQKLDEILLFIEPNAESLAAYSHKTRELLILACTDIEAQWKYHLERAGVMAVGQGFTTNDYVRLRDPLHLREYSVSLPRYAEIPDLRPFSDWSRDPGPTQTIPWYDAYNKTKHDRQGHFAEGTLLACIQAIAANIVMFSVRFGPFRLYNGGGMLSALFNPMFDVSLVGSDPRSFYVPELDVAAHVNLTWGHADSLPRAPRKFCL